MEQASKKLEISVRGQNEGETFQFQIPWSFADCDLGERHFDELTLRVSTLETVENSLEIGPLESIRFRSHSGKRLETARSILEAGNATEGPSLDPSISFSSDEIDDLEKRLDTLLCAGLPVGSRPVLGARLNCIVPMSFEPIDESETRVTCLRQAALDAVNNQKCDLKLEDIKADGNYLLQHVRPLLTPLAPEVLGIAANGRTSVSAEATEATAQLDERLVTLELNNKPNLRLKAALGDDASRKLEAKLSDIRMHFYAERVCAASWSISSTNPQPQQNEHFWRYLCRGNSKDPRLQTVTDWLDLSARAREVFSSFEATPDEVGVEQKLATLTLEEIGDGDSSSKAICSQRLHFEKDVPNPKNRRPPIVGVLDQLLQMLLRGIENKPKGDLGWTSLFTLQTDDRARLVQSMVIAGQQPAPSDKTASKQLDVVHARTVMADPWGEDFPYDPAFSRAETNSGAYDRFRSFGSRFLVNDHCFAFVGFGSYAYEEIHADHMAGNYRRMMLLILMNAAVLQKFTREIAAKLSGWLPGVSNSDEALEFYRQLMPRFTKFANLNWLEAVTSQLQGVEMFSLMLERSQAIRDYAFLREEIARTDHYLELEAEARSREQAEVDTLRRNWITTFGAIIGVGFTLLGVIQGSSLPFVPAFILWVQEKATGAAHPDFVKIYGGVIASTLTISLAGLAFWRRLLRLPGMTHQGLSMPEGWVFLVVVGAITLPFFALAPDFCAIPMLVLCGGWGWMAYAARPQCASKGMIGADSAVSSARLAWGVLTLAMALHLIVAMLQLWGFVDVASYVETLSATPVS